MRDAFVMALANRRFVTAEKRRIPETNGERIPHANLSLCSASPAFQPAVSRAGNPAQTLVASDA
jgi:hypothetical protein